VLPSCYQNKNSYKVP